MSDGIRYYVTARHAARRDLDSGDVLHARYWNAYLKRLCQLAETASMYDRVVDGHGCIVTHKFTMIAPDWPTIQYRAYTTIDAAAVGASMGGDFHLDYPKGLELIYVGISTTPPEKDA